MLIQFDISHIVKGISHIIDNYCLVTINGCLILILECHRLLFYKNVDVKYDKFHQQSYGWLKTHGLEDMVK